MRSQDRGIDKVRGVNHHRVKPLCIAAWNRERNRVGFEFRLHSPVAADVVHKHDARELIVDLVI